MVNSYDTSSSNFYTEYKIIKKRSVGEQEENTLKEGKANIIIDN